MCCFVKYAYGLVMIVIKIMQEIGIEDCQRPWHSPSAKKPLKRTPRREKGYASERPRHSNRPDGPRNLFNKSTQDAACVRQDNSLTMPFRIGPPYLCLLILSLCSASATALILDLESNAPTSYWVDQSCIQKGFPPSTARESLLMATRGARRLLNLNDAYQAWLFRLLFKVPRDFSLFDEDAESLAWDVVGEWLAVLL